MEQNNKLLGFFIKIDDIQNLPSESSSYISPIKGILKDTDVTYDDIKESIGISQVTNLDNSFKVYSTQKLNLISSEANNIIGFDTKDIYEEEINLDNIQKKYIKIYNAEHITELNINDSIILGIDINTKKGLHKNGVIYDNLYKWIENDLDLIKDVNLDKKLELFFEKVDSDSGNDKGKLIDEISKIYMKKEKIKLYKDRLEKSIRDTEANIKCSEEDYSNCKNKENEEKCKNETYEDEDGKNIKYKNCEDKLKEIECRQKTYKDDEEGDEDKNFKSCMHIEKWNASEEKKKIDAEEEECKKQEYYNEYDKKITFENCEELNKHKECIKEKEAEEINAILNQDEKLPPIKFKSCKHIEDTKERLEGDIVTISKKISKKFKKDINDILKKSKEYDDLISKKNEDEENKQKLSNSFRKNIYYKKLAKYLKKLPILREYQYFEDINNKLINNIIDQVINSIERKKSAFVNYTYKYHVSYPNQEPSYNLQYYNIPQNNQSQMYMQQVVPQNNQSHKYIQQVVPQNRVYKYPIYYN